MADESNPRSLNFQMAHLCDLHKQLPRHAAADQAAIQQAMALLRGLDLQRMEFPLPGGDAPAADSGHSQVDRSLASVQKLLRSWADNISLTYFDHAHTYPISIGG
jgi:uncharacterized alpha-E superfamily protein